MGDEVFGNRKLLDEQQVFDHNSWDDVAFTQEELLSAQKIILKQKESPVAIEEKEALIKEPCFFWNKFYSHNQNNFFKDRKWIGRELDRIIEDTRTDCESIRIFEIGCGVGNSLFPLTDICGPNDFVYACDFSENAVSIIQQDSRYDPSKMNAFVHDMSSEENFPRDNMDLITIIFALSAVHPSKMQHCVDKIYQSLKPGGKIVFRDYAKYDLTQLRFKAKRLIDDDLYARGDGTLVFFFTKEYVLELFSKFNILQIHEDRRLLVNRSRLLRMHRSWLHGVFEKPKK